VGHVVAPTDDELLPMTRSGGASSAVAWDTGSAIVPSSLPFHAHPNAGASSAVALATANATVPKTLENELNMLLSRVTVRFRCHLGNCHRILHACLGTAPPPPAPSRLYPKAETGEQRHLEVRECLVVCDPAWPCATENIQAAEPPSYTARDCTLHGTAIVQACHCVDIQVQHPLRTSRYRIFFLTATTDRI